MSRHITEEHIEDYVRFLQDEERSSGTIEKYRRDLEVFRHFLGIKEVTKELTAQWKEHLAAKGYAPVTINSMLSAINGFFKFVGWNEYRVKFLRVQRRLFREPERELSRSEYRRLLEEARKRRQERLALLMESICATGIRVSEIRYLTLEAIRQGRTEIALKGKIRTILLPSKLCRKLLRYAEEQGISGGPLFITRNGRTLSRCQIWQEMKRLCRQAGVKQTKVFPHNLRHLFATVFYRASRDIVQLADILGHSCIETTRIYLLTTGREHMERLDRLGLVDL